MSGKPPREALPERIESMLTRLAVPGPRTDYMVSVTVLRMLAAMKRQASRQPLDADMMGELMEAAMRGRRLFVVEGADGRSSIRQHPARPTAPQRKH